MARLQILELPAGSNDDRPPFILVVDEYTPRWYITGLDQPEPVSEFDGVAEKIGARAVLVFEDTIDIPANDTSGYLDSGEATAATLDDCDVRAAIAADMQKMRDANQAQDAALHSGPVIQTPNGPRPGKIVGRAAEAIERVRRLHQPVEHRGQTICWACSDYDFPGQTTDSPPVAYDQCATLRALDGGPAADA
ncbi:hypothetical protein [Streptomyces sp. SID8499]|uniref:hypothetical protein n=1 Tax=Streptomyces sp. SID8499 TaxID=2706106 RepID=UPI0013C84E19|nr:hypothetical protein [Streptomyces sp. SID8499]NED31102.1 hypothetical protein [Streptomyces sp. SID8499]